jgi:hypothetical protein
MAYCRTADTCSVPNLLPIKELQEAFARLPRIDYAKLRADFDTNIDQDPTPRV